MTTLVIGASGSTGKHLVDQLLQSNQRVKIIVRSPEKLPESWKTNKQVSIIQANVSEITVDEMAKYVKDCHAIASCLGHSLTWQGLYGKPRTLVTNAVSLICRAILKNAPNNPVKVVWMNTSGNRNRDLNEPISVGERMVVSVLRVLIPPHVDNEDAADYLRTKIGQDNNLIQWIAVRPDTLINEDKVSEYQVFPSPTRSAFFNPGKVSRINVGHFMAKLLTEKDVWAKWKGQMPVIYNKCSSNNK